MKVLVYTDPNGYVNAYDVSNQEKMYKIFGSIANDLGGDKEDIVGMTFLQIKLYFFDKFGFHITSDKGKFVVIDVMQEIDRYIEI